MTIALDTAGLHPATGLCLEAMQWLQERYEFRHILDMGCGNGILSVIAASIWDAKVMAVDIAPKAVEDTKRQVAAHGLEGRITVLRSEGFRDPAIAAAAPFDLILFNLLAEPIVQMALPVQAHLAEGGICVIGGLLAWKAPGALEAYTRLGFEILKEMNISPWRLYVLRHGEIPPVTKA